MSGRPLIFLFLILFTNCSALKTGKTITEQINNPCFELANVKNQNLSANDFNIKKAEIEINIDNEKQKLLASVKYKTPGRWLICLKSTTGIEVARAFITVDTLLINDRLHKKLYYGSIRSIEKKYGIPFITLPVLFGDFIAGNVSVRDSAKCIDGRDMKTFKFGESEIEYLLSCKDNKIISSKIRRPGGNEIQVSYSKMKLVNKYKYPARLIIRDPSEKCILEIKIRNIEFKNIEKVDFIPGKGYNYILLK
jgi:hypothetical protein